jgi:hypothetical protein
MDNPWFRSAGLKCPQVNPTRRLPKGGVLHKRKSSSFARLNHSCVRNAWLDLEKEP